MVIEKVFLTPNEYSRPGFKLKKVTAIAVHYVGNAGSSAKANRNYFENLKDTKDRKVSSHFIVGLDGEVIQCIPLTEWSYCTNKANGYSISIECCHPDSTGKFNEKTEQSLVELCAYLCRKFGLSEKDVIRHYDVTGKRCPLWYVTHPEAWEKFRAMVKNQLADRIEVEESFLVRILDSELNIRKGPSLTADIVGKITDNGVYTIVGTERGNGILWGRLKSGAGWISLGSRYVKRLRRD